MIEITKGLIVDLCEEFDKELDVEAQYNIMASVLSDKIDAIKTLVWILNGHRLTGIYKDVVETFDWWYGEYVGEDRPVDLMYKGVEEFKRIAKTWGGYEQ